MPDFSETYHQWNMDSWDDDARDILLALAKTDPDEYLHSPMRDAANDLAARMRNLFMLDADTMFGRSGMWADIANNIACSINWRDLALTYLLDHAPILYEVPSTWYSTLTHAQTVILMWADNTGSLYAEKRRLTKLTRDNGIAAGWHTWAHDAYTDYLAHHDHDPDAVSLSYDEVHNLAYYCETRALFDREAS